MISERTTEESSSDSSQGPDPVGPRDPWRPSPQGARSKRHARMTSIAAKHLPADASAVIPSSP
jgi:hypothetical protein